MEASGDTDPSILTEPVLTVRFVWLGPGRIEYRVLDERGSPLATARYLPEDQLGPLLRSYGLRQRTAAALQVVDADGADVFTVVFPGMRARAVMFIRDRDGQHVGEAVKTKGVFKARYELRHGGQTVGAIQVLDWRERGVRIEDPAGVELASIRTIDDGYSLRVLRPMDEPLRSLVCASTVALQAAIGDESRPGSDVEFGGGTTILRLPLLPPIFDPLRRKRR
jgi:hypothetical protein